MNKTGLIITVIIILLIIIIYFFRDKLSTLFGKGTPTVVSTPTNNTVPVPTPLCSDGITPVSNSTPCPTKCSDGTFQQDAMNCPLGVGDVVYLNPNAPYAGSNGATGIPIYSYPIVDAPYLQGVTRFDWHVAKPIGKVVSINGNWVQVSLSDFQIWRFLPNVGYTTNVAKLTGDFFFSLNSVKKTPY